MMNTTISLFLLLASAWFDAKGFRHAAQAWDINGQLVIKQCALSILYFLIGIIIYVISVRFLNLLGVSSATAQTLLWFVATIVGVAILSGDIWKWSSVQYIALLVTIAGMGVLLISSEH